MSVIAAMTMDDQRPLLNTYSDKMQEQQQKYNEQQNINTTLAFGPASPTPSGSEEPMSQQYHHQMSHYHPTSTSQQHIYTKQHHYAPQRADISKNNVNITDQKLQQQQQSSLMIEEQQQKHQQHNEQAASMCAVTVKAESVGVIDANHGQPLLEGI